MTSDVFHALAHIAQAASAFVLSFRGQATPVVLDFQNKMIGLQMQAQPGGRGVGVFDDVVNCFFDGEEDIVTQFR